ncbi:hypothetical protein B0T22DRAFT_475505 [Podospora appendiculata]|uniref:TM7S3/TM198-like domain-containing protein n=1 Tax=Podospora appendiculata TaxID=314037 RepID=A0AAE1CFG2_9PEZI|nr:hypothetical protein B0T22DRAFT_475505 [Podospora appendiculata]
MFNTSIPAGQLPLEPAITPGWAVAGVVLLGAGVVYAMVGIRTKWLHTFFSTAFLASLGTSVLIIYVMVPPVSNPIQGAYVVAAVCTGLILGGLAIIFKEIAECLGCLLGGFCLSMWLLTLQAGGLIKTVDGKVGFIAAFTIVGFAMYFTRWTRAYSLIACNCFSGATAAVLGIDCFSRAGYKEFWAYLWALNDNVFPLGTETYPLTRGMRVEIAVTILIFLSGIVSQLKLWRIIKERRDKHDAEVALGEQTLRAEEENIGRKVEEMTSRERREWEQVYGDGSTSPVDSTDSGVCDLESEKRLRHSKGASTTTTTRALSTTEIGSNEAAVCAVDGTESPPSNALNADLALSRDIDGSRVTIRVGQDDFPVRSEENTPLEKGKESEIREKSELKRASSITSMWRRNSQGANPSPAIVPLPFTIPATRENDDRSSVATFADEDDGEHDFMAQVRDGKAGSMVRRLSNSSVELLRRFSQRSSPIKTEEGGTAGASYEGLVGPALSAKDETDSIAGNLDEMSSDGDLESVREWKSPRYVDMSLDTDARVDGAGEMPLAEQIEKELGIGSLVGTERRTSAADTLFTASTGLPAAPQAAGNESRRASAAEQGSKVGADAEERDISLASPELTYTHESDTKSSKRPKSVASVDSVAASLTRGNLPRSLSRVALSYRTNEWAKHLSVAETPEPDSLHVHERLDEAGSHGLNEEPAPLDVVDLQQTAENAAPARAAPRSASALSNYTNQPHAVSRSSSRASLSGHQEATGFPMQVAGSPEPLSRNRLILYRSMSGTLRGRSSLMFAEPIAEEGDVESYRTPKQVTTESGLAAARSMSPQPLQRELSTSVSVPNLSMFPNTQGVASLEPPQTLIGMRERLLRNKLSGTWGPSAADAAAMGIMDAAIPNARPDSRHGSDSGSLNNYPIFTSGASGEQSLPLDTDDIPLSQRRLMIRQSNLNLAYKASRQRLAPSIQQTSVESVGFDSHQPTRRSYMPSEAARQAQLANFRNSVAADLRTSASFAQLSSSGGRDSAAVGPSISIRSLRGAYGRDSVDIQRHIEVQRNFLLGQKEAEAQRRKTERQEQEQGQREFEVRMRSGALMGAHRDAMRRLQRGVRHE